MATLSVGGTEIATSSGVTFPTGHVLQTLQGGNTVASSGTIGLHTATPSTLPTVLSLAITPSLTSSKVLITFNVSLSGPGGSAAVHLLRGSTDIGIGDAAGSRVRTLIALGDGLGGPQGQTYSSPTQHGMYLDSPSTTSATTYYVKVSMYNASTYYVNRSVNDRDNAAGYDGRGSSWIILQEIA